MWYLQYIGETTLIIVFTQKFFYQAHYVLICCIVPFNFADF
jgi:hypothetical protein